MCECCRLFRENEQFPQFSDRCPYCQARMIQRIQRELQITPAEKSKRCTAVIEECREWKLDEAQVRKLAKAPERAVQPVVAKGSRK